MILSRRMWTIAAAGAALLLAIKDAVDPDGLLNPGTLLPPR
jgi:FAD/FMN-containing dehydrogenase